jgi:hypothetical protein
MKHFPSYKDGKQIFLLLNIDVLIISLCGEKKELIKYTFSNILYYPNDILIGLDEINNILLFQPTRYSIMVTEDSNPEESFMIAEKSIVEDVEYEYTLSLNKTFDISDDIRLADTSNYNDKLLVVFSRVMLAILNIKDFQINQKREHRYLNDVIYSQERLVCATTDEVVIYCMSDMTNTISIKGNFFVYDMSNVLPGMLIFSSKIDQSYISLYNVKEDKIRQRSFGENMDDPIYSKAIADDENLSIAVLDKNWKLRVMRCSIE